MATGRDNLSAYYVVQKRVTEDHAPFSKLRKNI